jgi:hypothetical protein
LIHLLIQILDYLLSRYHLSPYSHFFKECISRAKSQRRTVANYYGIVPTWDRIVLSNDVYRIEELSPIYVIILKRNLSLRFKLASYMLPTSVSIVSVCDCYVFERGIVNRVREWNTFNFVIIVLIYGEVFFIGGSSSYGE